MRTFVRETAALKGRPTYLQPETCDLKPDERQAKGGGRGENARPTLGDSAGTHTRTAERPVATSTTFATHENLTSSSLRISAHVSASGTVKVVLHNPTSEAVTVESGEASVLVFPAMGVALPATTGTVTGTVTVNLTPTDQCTVAISVGGVPNDSAAPNGSGVYTFSNVPAGVILVTATGSGVWMGYSGSNTDTLAGGATLVLDIAMESI